MLIRLGYDIELQISQPMTVVAVLNVHPSRAADLREPDEIQISPDVPRQQYLDSFGNVCTRIIAPQGPLRLSNSTLIEDSGQPDPVDWSAAAGACRKIARRNSAISAGQPLLRSGPALSISPGNCSRTLSRDGRGRRRFAIGSINISRSATTLPVPPKTADGCACGMPGSLQRFPASGDHTLPRDAYSGTICDGVSGRHWSSARRADGLQRMVRGFSGGQMVDV